MRKFLLFNDGMEVELTPLTYDEFMQLDHWSGGSDGSFNKFLRDNNYRELDEFDDDALKTAKIVFKKGEQEFIISDDSYEKDENPFILKDNLR